MKDENSNAASNTAESDVAPINATKGSRTTTKIEGAGVGSVKKRLPSDVSVEIYVIYLYCIYMSLDLTTKVVALTCTHNTTRHTFHHHSIVHVTHNTCIVVPISLLKLFLRLVIQLQVL